MTIRRPVGRRRTNVTIASTTLKRKNGLTMSAPTSAKNLRRRPDAKKCKSSRRQWKNWRDSDVKRKSRKRKWLQSERQENGKRLTGCVDNREKMRP